MAPIQQWVENPTLVFFQEILGIWATSFSQSLPPSVLFGSDSGLYSRAFSLGPVRHRDHGRGFQTAVSLLTSLSTQLSVFRVLLPQGSVGEQGQEQDPSHKETAVLFSAIPFRARLRKFSLCPPLILKALFFSSQTGQLYHL